MGRSLSNYIFMDVVELHPKVTEWKNAVLTFLRTNNHPTPRGDQVYVWDLVLIKTGQGCQRIWCWWKRLDGSWACICDDPLLPRNL